MHLRWTDYEIWWKGADDQWRLAKKYDRADRALEYVRRLHQEYPDVQVTVFKRWQIRHKMWEWKSDQPSYRFPEATKLEQLELENGEHRTEDSQNPRQDEPAAGSDPDRPDGQGVTGDDAGQPGCEGVDKEAVQQ